MSTIEGYDFEINEVKQLAEVNGLTESDMFDLMYQFLDDIIAYYHMERIPIEV